MDIQPIFRCAVGMDVHLAIIHVCVILQIPDGEPQVHRRQFSTFQRDLRAMAEWIAGFSPETVVMESTGIYWKSPYAYLEKVGLRALVVNAQHVKKVPGRKTDTSDAEWLAMLARAGLLRGSFIPPEDIRTLRQISRYHHRTTAMLAAEKNRLVRVLSDAGIRITAVVSDAHGVAARAMIDCLLDGGTPEQALAYAGRLKAPREELLASLQGELSEDHRFVAAMIRRHITTLESQLADLEHRLFNALKPHEAALQLLLTIPGIDRLAAAKLVVEIGFDMSAFGTAGRLAKWAGVCPGNDESAGKRRSGKTTPGNRYVRTVLCEIAWAAIRTTSQFKSRYHSLVIRRGTKKAIIAIGHHVLKTVFVLLSRQVPYHDSTVDYEALRVQRNAPRWIRELKKFGYLPKAA
jgi:transposase